MDKYLEVFRDGRVEVQMKLLMTYAQYQKSVTIKSLEEVQEQMKIFVSEHLLTSNAWPDFVITGEFNVKTTVVFDNNSCLFG